MDEIIFQPAVAANSEQVFEVSFSENIASADSIPACYSNLWARCPKNERRGC